MPYVAFTAGCSDLVNKIYSQNWVIARKFAD